LAHGMGTKTLKNGTKYEEEYKNGQFVNKIM
jgi:hypothetical protein